MSSSGWPWPAYETPVPVGLLATKDFDRDLLERDREFGPESHVPVIDGPRPPSQRGPSPEWVKAAVALLGRISKGEGGGLGGELWRQAAAQLVKPRKSGPKAKRLTAHQKKAAARWDRDWRDWEFDAAWTEWEQATGNRYTPF